MSELNEFFKLISEAKKEKPVEENKEDKVLLISSQHYPMSKKNKMKNLKKKKRK